MVMIGPDLDLRFLTAELCGIHCGQRPQQVHATRQQRRLGRGRIGITSNARCRQRCLLPGNRPPCIRHVGVLLEAIQFDVLALLPFAQGERPVPIGARQLPSAARESGADALPAQSGRARAAQEQPLADPGEHTVFGSGWRYQRSWPHRAHRTSARQRHWSWGPGSAARSMHVLAVNSCVVKGNAVTQVRCNAGIRRHVNALASIGAMLVSSRYATNPSTRCIITARCCRRGCTRVGAADITVDPNADDLVWATAWRRCTRHYDGNAVLRNYSREERSLKEFPVSGGSQGNRHQNE